ncbi:MAG TPA: hypothetical protein PK930_09705, partial [Leptospiraceae bacterium]|nr:hypothetical protein [Leptospiraceae bacterium]
MIFTSNSKFLILNILISTLFFTNCTAWPAISAILLSGNKKSGMIPLLPIGGSSPANGSQTTTTPETPPT